MVGFRRCTERIIALVGTFNRTVSLAGSKFPMANFQLLTQWSNFLPHYLSKLTAVATLRNRRSSNTANVQQNKTASSVCVVFNKQKLYTLRKVMLFDNSKFKFASCFGHHISHTHLKYEIHFFRDRTFLEPYTSFGMLHKNFRKSMHITVTFLYFLCNFLSIQLLLPPCPIAKVFMIYVENIVHITELSSITS